MSARQTSDELWCWLVRLDLPEDMAARVIERLLEMGVSRMLDFKYLNDQEVADLLALVTIRLKNQVFEEMLQEARRGTPAQAVLNWLLGAVKLTAEKAGPLLDYCQELGVNDVDDLKLLREEHVEELVQLAPTFVAKERVRALIEDIRSSSPNSCRGGGGGGGASVNTPAKRRKVCESTDANEVDEPPSPTPTEPLPTESVAAAPESLLLPSPPTATNSSSSMSSSTSSSSSSRGGRGAAATTAVTEEPEPFVAPLLRRRRSASNRRGAVGSGAVGRPLRLEASLEALLSQADAAYNAKDYVKAAELYAKVCAQNPTYSARAWRRRGFCLTKGPNASDHALVAEKEKCYHKAIELDPNFANTHYNLGVMLQKKRDLRGAEKAYRKAIELDWKRIDARLYLGDVLKARADAEEKKSGGGDPMVVAALLAEAAEHWEVEYGAEASFMVAAREKARRLRA